MRLNLAFATILSRCLVDREYHPPYFPTLFVQLFLVPMAVPTPNHIGSQQATFSYFQLQPHHEHEKPYEILIDLPEEAQHVPRSNLAFETADCIVEDARGHEAEFEIDSHGFMWRRLRTAVEDLKDRASIETEYFQEVEQFLRGLLGPQVRKVKFFNWKV